MIPLDHRDRGNRADPYTEHNSCFSDSSDSLNSLNSLNSMKVPLHLEKTPLFHNFWSFDPWISVLSFNQSVLLDVRSSDRITKNRICCTLFLRDVR